MLKSPVQTKRSGQESPEPEVLDFKLGLSVWCIKRYTCHELDEVVILTPEAVDFPYFQND